LETPNFRGCCLMKILVAIKRVVDPYVKIRVKTDGSGIDTEHLKKSINPFDEIAIEEALRIKEKGLADEVVLVSIGDDKTQETLRAGLALGADRAIHVNTARVLSSLTIAKILSHLVHQENPQLILLGKQSIDNEYSQTGAMLAGLLAYPQVTFASSIVLEGNMCEVTREVDGGLETLSVDLPAVITTDLRLNTPRYASLPNIMKAKSKPLALIDFEGLGIVDAGSIETLAINEPPKRQAGKIVSTAKELVELLKHEAKVIS
jgi:electron transfer flavoprotein beta subunit